MPPNNTIIIMQITCMQIPYSGLFSRGKIFTNFADWPQFANIFPLKLYSVWLFINSLLTIRENFPLEMTQHRAFVKNFPLENNLLYGTYLKYAKVCTL